VPPPLSFSVNEPPKAPDVTGAKVTVTAQLAPGPRVLPQLFVWLKGEVLPAVMLEIVSVVESDRLGRLEAAVSVAQ
jgi:hypothetical protein